MLHEFFLQPGAPLTVVEVDKERDGEDGDGGNKRPPKVIEQNNRAEEQHERQGGHLREVPDHEHKLVCVDLYEIDHLARGKLLISGG